MSRLTNIEHRIAWLLSERMAREVASYHTDLLDTGAIDSTGFVELLHHIEQEFDLRFRVEELDIDQFRSISRIAAFVAGKGGGRLLGEVRLHGNRSTLS